MRAASWAGVGVASVFSFLAGGVCGIVFYHFRMVEVASAQCEQGRNGVTAGLREGTVTREWSA